MTDPGHFEPGIDDLTRYELAEAHPDVYIIALTLDEWLYRERGVLSSHHHAGAFLDLLASNGYEIVKKEPMPFTDLDPSND